VLNAEKWGSLASNFMLRTPRCEHGASIYLFIRYQLANVMGLYRRHQCRLSQTTFLLLAFARQNMALESFVPLDFAGSGHAKPLGGSSVGFYLGHF
jgi:hypothetical protein